jgi:hypothetical protein
MTHDKQLIGYKIMKLEIIEIKISYLLHYI